MFWLFAWGVVSRKKSPGEKWDGERPLGESDDRDGGREKRPRFGGGSFESNRFGVVVKGVVVERPGTAFKARVFWALEGTRP